MQKAKKPTSRKLIRYDLNTAQCQVTEVLPAQSADSSSLPLSLNSETGVFAYRKAASQFWFLVNLQTSSEPKMLTLTVFSCSIVSNGEMFSDVSELS